MEIQNTKTVVGLFPQPVYINKLDGAHEGSANRFDTCEMTDDMADEYGQRSVNSYILHEQEHRELLDLILKEVSFFCTEVLQFNYSEYILTQSWVTHKKPGQHHQMHNHPNSLISGSFYYDALYTGSPALRFHKPPSHVTSTSLPYLMPRKNESVPQNEFTSDYFDVYPEKNLLVMFPSQILHSVPKNQSGSIRKSIAFNVVPKTGFGEVGCLTELKIAV